MEHSTQRRIEAQFGFQVTELTRTPKCPTKFTFTGVLPSGSKVHVRVRRRESVYQAIEWTVRRHQFCEMLQSLPCAHFTQGQARAMVGGAQ